MQAEFILYVQDQQKSCEFYSRLLNMQPALNVPGMTEFLLTENCKLGLMPNAGIKKILENKTPDPESGTGIPRCEIYLLIKNPDEYIERGLSLGAKLISEMQNRDWGDRVGYIADPDGHIIAFAEKIE